MELKYVVVEEDEGSNYKEVLFEFDDPQTAMQVCQQLKSRKEFDEFCVVVRYA